MPNVIMMIGDGMGWEMARAAAIAKQIQDGKAGNSLSDFYTSGKGTGLSFQNLSGYSLVTTYGTTIADKTGIYSTGNSALDGSDPTTGGSAIRPGFTFDPTFNPGTTAAGGANATTTKGNLVGYDPAKGGLTPWDAGYYGGTAGAGFDKNYITYSYPDSANTATTLYTGVKSYNNAIGVDIFEQPLETILMTANMRGMSTGLVTSVPIDHATPGAAAAAVNRRSKYDGDYPNLDNILQQELSIYQPTVLLGGGHPFSNTAAPLPNGVEPARDYSYITQSTYDYLKANPTDNRYGYDFLERGVNAATTLAQTAATLDPNKGDRLVGLYGARGQNGNLPVSSANGDYSTTGLDMFSVNTTKGLKPDTIRPLNAGETDAQFIARERNENPTLSNLTDAALNILGKDKDGFWLMVEGGDVDWSAHDNNLDNLIGTMLDFDKAVASTINWIQKNGGWENNLLIVTADHDHYLTLNPDYPTLLRTKGAEALTNIDTVAESGQFWGPNSSDKYGWGSHTNRPVPVYYQGVGSDVLSGFVGKGYESYGKPVTGVAGAVDQSQLYQTMLSSITGATKLPMNNGDQTFYGTDKDDVVYTGTGNDIIYANEGRNEIFANNGNNRIHAGNGNDVIYTGIGNDIIYANEGENTIFSGDGDDKIHSGNAMDVIYAGAGNDVIYANEGNNFIYAGPGNDTIHAGNGNDTIDLGAGDNIVYANEGKNVITGSGNNRIHAGNGNDVITLGAGNNTIYANEGNNTVTVALGKNEIYAGNGNDIINLTAGTNLVYANGGDNIITSAGMDTIYTGAGKDTFKLAAGTGEATIIGFDQTDRIALGGGLKFVDLVLKQVGADTVLSAGADTIATLKWTQSSSVTAGLFI
jgi:alkaline phosphatase